MAEDEVVKLGDVTDLQSLVGRTDSDGDEILSVARKGDTVYITYLLGGDGTTAMRYDMDDVVVLRAPDPFDRVTLPSENVYYAWQLADGSFGPWYAQQRNAVARGVELSTQTNLPYRILKKSTVVEVVWQ